MKKVHLSLFRKTEEENHQREGKKTNLGDLLDVDEVLGVVGVGRDDLGAARDLKVESGFFFFVGRGRR